MKETDIPVKDKMKNVKKERVSNFGVATYIAESQGLEVCNEKLIQVAKAMNLKQKVLIRNYQFVVKMHMMFDGLNAQ